MTTVSPVETISFANKSQEVSSLHMNQLHKEDAKAIVANQDMQQQNVIKQERTEKSGDAHDMNLKHDAKEKGKGMYFKQEQERRKAEKEKEEQETRKRLSGSTFDITI
ncbi:MAG: hypothetical protein K6B75_00400 [Lachnospiraceae bacterium]|nr:hypothetical protein [Lachnospiraceae bacterium]